MDLISRPVYVEWIDSSSCYGWREPDPTSDPDLKCWTLGFLITESENSVTVASSVSATGHVSNQMTIPRAAITVIREIAWV